LVGDAGITTGDNSTVQAIANRFNSQIRFSPTGLLGGSNRTLADYGAQILALNASQARNVSDLRSSREFLVENLSNTVASVSGVNLDEEMANLVILQNAYAASARVIDVTSQMFEALAQIIR
jgi:flagellar hook-associated protein 1 FlgK